jgi:hypothetical protein
MSVVSGRWSVVGGQWSVVNFLPASPASPTSPASLPHSLTPSLPHTLTLCSITRLDRGLSCELEI